KRGGVRPIAWASPSLGEVAARARGAVPRRSTRASSVAISGLAWVIMSVMPPFVARGLISSDERWPGEILPGGRKRARDEQRLKLGTALGSPSSRRAPHERAVTSNTEPTLRPPAGGSSGMIFHHT